MTGSVIGGMEMMQMINVLFFKITQMSLTAGIVILVVLFVRLLIRRLPRSFAYALWLVVAFRLVVPAAADSDISIFNMFPDGSMDGKTAGAGNEAGRPDMIDKNMADRIGEQTMYGYTQNNIADAKDTSDTKWNTGPVELWDWNNELTSYGQMFFNHISNSDRKAADQLYWNEVLLRIQDSSLVGILAFVWIAGILTLVSYTVIAQMQLRRKIRYSIRLSGNVYECDQIRSPFVIGIVSPRIYLPFRLRETEQQCILAHEQYHIKRRDHLIKGFAYLLVMVYWFHPFVWIAYHLMCIDMEMSCDEKIILQFTVELRKEYSRLLLAFATNKRQLPTGPLAFGEESTMKRIKNILNYKKAAHWKLAAGAAVLVLTTAACATDARTDESLATEPDTVPGMTKETENTTGVSYGGLLNVTDASGPKEGADSVQDAAGRRFVEHHPAQWAENSMFDMEFYSLDYADSDRIVFHISSGLFEYDLNQEVFAHSIDLKALNCQAVQSGGECKVSVYRYQNGDHQLRAEIRPYPYSDKGSYIYDLASDELFVYDASLLKDYVLFDGFVSKYDPVVSEAMRTWRAAENVLPLEGNSYGALYWGPGPDLANMCYEAGGQTWNVFRSEQATLPKLVRQDDSFYQSFSLYSGREISQCLIDYSAFYNRHDYAGVCALSTGLEYSDELWQEFGRRTDSLLYGKEVSHSEDEKEYLFEFTYSDGSGGDEDMVYLKFQYLEGEGWRAVGLPSAEPME